MHSAMPKPKKEEKKWPQKSPGLSPVDYFILSCGPCKCPKHKQNLKRLNEEVKRKSKEEYYDFVMERMIREMY